MKKILMVTEFSQLNTGYAIYSHEILKRLHASGKYQIAELACYITEEDQRIQNVPWKVYANMPPSKHPAHKLFNQDSAHAFGEWSFEHILLEFQPDIVFDIRDFWMMEFECRSAYRPCYSWVIMPTVDSVPQQEQWLDSFSTAEAVLTYTDWSGKVLQDYSKRINWCGSAPPCASKHLYPLTDRKAIKSLLGRGPNVKILGTVMRNQPRKLYPELFRVFREYLDRSKSKDTFLYCHVAYPDTGWDIPLLIKEFGLSTKVFLTYVCEKCKYSAPLTYQDIVTFCPKCSYRAFHTATAQAGITHDMFCQIYNMMDLYVQYANSEGFGLPQVEAAACGTPISGTDYSAMEDVVRKLEGYPIKVAAFTRDMNTGCNKARPSDEHFIEILTTFFNLPEPLRDLKRQQTRRAFEQNYNWDTTAQKWDEVFEQMPTGNWKKPIRIHNPASPVEELNRLTHPEYAKWLIVNVLGEPERLGTYFEARIIRDLTYGMHQRGMGGMYYNEQSYTFDRPKLETFTRETAYNEMRMLCERRNQFELVRKQRLGL